MKAFHSIFRKGQRPKGPIDGPRKRPSRSFASTFAALEGRALLSTVGPVILPTTATAMATTTAYSTAAAPVPLTSMAPEATENNQNGHPFTGSMTMDGMGSPPPPDHHDPSKFRVSMDVGKLTIDGQPTLEFALADQGRSQVFVRLGLNGSTVVLGPSQGISHPLSVKLADLNGDGIPDLIVANTGANNVLIFPGMEGGQFGPEINGGLGYAVGDQPVGITVNYVNNDPGRAEIIVADQGTLTGDGGVSILQGHLTTTGWSATAAPSITTQARPVETLLYDSNEDGIPDLFVVNSGSNTVSEYQGLPGGAFEAAPSDIYHVGVKPMELFIGQFDNHPEPDLLTINSGSDNLTFISGFLGPNPTTQSISSGGLQPDAAFAIDPGHTGVMDLVVANSGDGHLAVFRGGNDGLQLAGVITQSSVTAPTALASSSAGADGINFYAANAGDDAALLLHFDLGVASSYLPGSSDQASNVLGQSDELLAQLTPLGESSLELIAILWAGSPESEAISGSWSLRESSTITALYSPTEGQGGDEAEKPNLPQSEPPPPLAKAEAPSLLVEDSRFLPFIVGIADAFSRGRGFLGAVAERDMQTEGLERPIEDLARLDQDLEQMDERPLDRDSEAASDAIDEALRMFWSEGDRRESPGSSDSDPRVVPATSLEGHEAPTSEGQLEAVPLISTVLVASTRLILKATPPRPSIFRRKFGLRRFVSQANDRDRPDLL